MKVETGKSQSIETIRGIACILLVAYHVVGNNYTNGLRLHPDHWLVIFNRIFEFVRMPLFSFISGLVFSAYVSNTIEWKKKVKSKVRRLLIPMIFVSSIHFLLQLHFADGSPSKMWQIYFLPYEHFWFLQSVFLLMLITLSISYKIESNDFSNNAWIGILVGSIVFITVERWRPDIFSAYKACYLATFFFLGLLIQNLRWNDDSSPVLRNRNRLIIAASAVLSFIIGCIVIFNSTNDSIFYRFVQVIVGINVCLLMLISKLEIRPLAWIGEKSYAIFLFHVFFTAGARILFDNLIGIEVTIILFAIGLFLGLIGPILANDIIMRSKFLSLILLGISKR